MLVLDLCNGLASAEIVSILKEVVTNPKHTGAVRIAVHEQLVQAFFQQAATQDGPVPNFNSVLLQAYVASQSSVRTICSS